MAGVVVAFSKFQFARAVLVLGGLAFALALSEAIVRIVGSAPEVAAVEKGRYRLSSNPRIGYELVPKLDYGGAALDYYGYRGSSNSLGYRDREHTVEKPPGVHRILVLGDSIAAGLGVLDYDKTFPGMLEGLLRRRGFHSEVLSFAVSGYNTMQEVATLEERGLRYSPDLVLLAYSLNDIEQNNGNMFSILLDEEARSGGVSILSSHPILLKSALWRFLRYRVYGSPALPQDRALARYNLLSRNTVGESFDLLGRLARENRFNVLVAVFPQFESLEPYPHAPEHETVRGYSVRNDFHHLDLLRAFQTCARASPEPLGLDPYHPTEEGHRCAAEAIADAIASEFPHPAK